MLLVRVFLNRVMYRETACAPQLCTESAVLGATARGLRLGARELRLGATAAGTVTRRLQARTRGDTRLKLEGFKAPRVTKNTPRYSPVLALSLAE